MAPTERSATVTIRLSPEEHEALVALAERDGLSQSDVLRQMLRARMASLRPERRTKVKLAPGDVPRVSLDSYTVVHDLGSNRTFMRFDGIVPLPIGAEIELTDPNVNARVTRVRMLAGNPSTLCLDVVRPER